MKHFLPLFLSILGLLLSFASCQRATATGDEENFTPLFNGRNFEGWIGATINIRSVTA